MSERTVLDASAILALLLDEPGGDAVAPLLDAACLGAVNLAEVLGRFTLAGTSADRVYEQIVRSGVQIQGVEEADARDIARLLPICRPFGLSLGDRACLALARRLSLPVVTADRAWAGLSLGVEVRVIR